MIVKREIDLELASNFEKNSNVEKAKLPINNDTSYDIYYDICEVNSQNYFYIKMIENTADAPFYYNRTYNQDDLCKIHKIFKANDIYETKKDIKSLFDQNKIKLSFDKNEEIIIMELDTMLFADNYKISFSLYKEMIPSENKDEKLIGLYSANKKNLKILKEILKINENFKNLIYSKEIPGIEKGYEEIIPIEKKIPVEKNVKNIKYGEQINPIVEQPKIERKESNLKILCKLAKLHTKYPFKAGKKDHFISLTLKNIYNDTWIQNKFELVCDVENSTLQPCEINYPPYDIAKGEDGDFTIKFRDDIEVGRYKCILYLHVNGFKKDDSKIELNIKVR